MKFTYAITILLNSFLLFLVQPVIAKTLLPYLGGTPSVWNTCMMFFQAALLGGYAYSHLSTKWLSPCWGLPLHLLLFGGAALVFPIHISEASLKSLEGGATPEWWLLGQLLVTVGLPFFMLSTNAPLLQQWFSKTDHPAAKDPYFLYSASNLGSLVALLGYPLLMEPRLRLGRQSELWSSGYLSLIGLLTLCAILRWKFRRPENEGSESNEESATLLNSITAGRRLRWLALAFVPSSLMLGVTTYISTDISPFPLLWVAPMALYLLTFILAFSRRQIFSTRKVARLLPIFGVLLTGVILWNTRLYFGLIISLHLLFFLLTAIVCHGRLSEDRPPARYLTEFYLYLAAGGMLGGIFNSLIAPKIFTTAVEYPLTITLALMLCPWPSNKPDRPPKRWLDFALPAALGALAAVLVIFLPKAGLDRTTVILLALGIPLIAGYGRFHNSLRFGLTVGAMMLAYGQFSSVYHRALHQERNFFGMSKVSEDKSGTFRYFTHGTTLHGAQYRDQSHECEPLSYFGRKGPLGHAMEVFAATPASPYVAVMGLGAGTLASYAGPGQEWTFYEIDPAVLRITQNNGYFSYLTKCASKPVKTILGDARLQLRNAPDNYYGLIVMDAFSSDAVPVHLLTKQAFDLYLAKLAPGGRLVVNISNAYINLRPVLGDLVANANLVGRANRSTGFQIGVGHNTSYWVVLARREEDLGSLATDRRWRPLAGNSKSNVWTDDYSNILNVIIWKYPTGGFEEDQYE